MSVLLGICGRMGSGKDTLADLLCKKYACKKDKFATSLYECASIISNAQISPDECDKLQEINMWDVPSLDLVDRVNEAVRVISGVDNHIVCGDIMEKLYEINPTSIGRLLQVLGTECFRDIFGKDVWINTLDKRLRGLTGCVIISDVRFPNEMEYIKSYSSDSKLIYISTNRLVGLSHMGMRLASHPSEVSINIDIVDIIVENNSTPEDMLISIPESLFRIDV